MKAVYTTHMHDCVHTGNSLSALSSREQGTGVPHPVALYLAHDMGLNELWASPSPRSVPVRPVPSQITRPVESGAP